MKLEMISRKAEGEAKERPILFAHGAWHGAWCWQENFLPHFAARGYDCYAVSYRDHGMSEKTGKLRWASVRHYVKDLEQAVAEVGGDPILVGHSMGGLVVQKYLENHTAPAAVLLAPVPVDGVWLTSLKIASRHPLMFAKALGTLSLYPVVHTPELARDAFFSDDLPEEDLSRHCALIQDESFRGFLDMLAFCLPRPKKVQRLPMLILGAKKDAIFSCSQMDRTARAYGASLKIYDMAHDMMLEPGWDEAADYIIDWLGQQGL